MRGRVRPKVGVRGSPRWEAVARPKWEAMGGQSGRSREAKMGGHLRGGRPKWEAKVGVHVRGGRPWEAEVWEWESDLVGGQSGRPWESEVGGRMSP